MPELHRSLSARLLLFILEELLNVSPEIDMVHLQVIKKLLLVQIAEHHVIVESVFVHWAVWDVLELVQNLLN